MPLCLREDGFGITFLEGQGMKGGAFVLYTVVPGKQVMKVLDILHSLEPEAFVTVDDVRFLSLDLSAAETERSILLRII